MKKNLLFDFNVDREARTVFVTREFDAALPLVWDAFTDPEILDQWWAPKPYISRTKSMDFKVGGRRFYAMVSPEGQEHWSVEEFTSITPRTNLQFRSAFADTDGNINNDMPESNWDLTFTNENGITRVSIVIKHTVLSDLEKMIAMGFKEGFTMTLNYLDNMLSGSRDK
jgi:uncharacterized protein YndB with AHSA1/START domain